MDVLIEGFGLKAWCLLDEGFQKLCYLYFSNRFRLMMLFQRKEIEIPVYTEDIILD